MVQVSTVSGTPLWLRDITVISQITGHLREGESNSPHILHVFHAKKLYESGLRRISASLCRPFNAIYTSLSLECKLPSGQTFVKQTSCVCCLFFLHTLAKADSFLLYFSVCQSENQAQINKSVSFPPFLLISFGTSRERKQQYGSLITETWFYNDNPWSNLACTMRVVVLVQMEILINSL